MLYIYYLSLVFKNNFENATDFFSFCYKILNKFQAYSLTGNFTSIHQFLKTSKNLSFYGFLLSTPTSCLDFGQFYLAKICLV